LFKSLEDKGLQLSEPTDVQLPQMVEGKKSFYNTMLVSRGSSSNASGNNADKGTA